MTTIYNDSHDNNNIIDNDNDKNNNKITENKNAIK